MDKYDDADYDDAYYWVDDDEYTRAAMREECIWEDSHWREFQDYCTKKENAI